MQKAQFRVGMKEGGLEAHLEMVIDGAVVGWADMDASGLAEFINVLGQVRSELADPVPHDLDENPRLAIVNDPRWLIFHSEDRAAPLALRHDAFGWLLFHLPEVSAKQLAETLSVALAGPPG